jgi:hypothetical protein
MIEGLLIYIAVVVSVMFYKLYPRSIKLSGKEFSYQIKKTFDGNIKKNSIVSENNVHRFQHKEK